MTSKIILLPLSLALLQGPAIAGTLAGVQAHVDGNVSLIDLLGGPPITDSFALDGSTMPQALAGDAAADSVIPSNATVQAVAESDSLAVVSEAANLTGVESPVASGTASLQGDLAAGDWVLNVTTEHVALLAGLDITVDAEIAYTVTDGTGTLVDETLTYSGPSDSFDTAQHAFNIAAGDTGLLTASVVNDAASPNFGTGLTFTLLQFDLLAVAVADADGDGVADAADNCTLAANPGQQDTDGDNIGNACDADFNNDCAVNLQDLLLLKQVFFSTDANADLNSDGFVNFADLAIVKDLIYGPPGPSGLPNDCD